MLIGKRIEDDLNIQITLTDTLEKKQENSTQNSLVIDCGRNQLEDD